MKNKNELHPNIGDFSVENLPFLFQEESYSVAWGIKHFGKFITPQGYCYAYEQPWPWNFCRFKPSSEDGGSVRHCYGYISSDDLLQNLYKSKVELPKLTAAIDIHSMYNQVEEIISTTPKIQISNFSLCDGPFIAQNIYIYRKKIEMYERFTLSHSGNIIVDHYSKEVSIILKKLEFNLKF